MTLATLVWRNLARHKARTMLAIVSILIAFLLFGVLMALRTNFAVPGDPSAANRLIVSHRAGFTQPLPLAHAARIAAIKGARAVSYRTLLGAEWRMPANNLLAVAVEPSSYFTLYPDLVIGAVQKADFVADPQTALVGASLAQRFGWRIGDVVPIRFTVAAQGGAARWTGRTLALRVAGIFTGRDQSTGTAMLLMHHRRLAGIDSGMVGEGQELIGNVLVLSSDAGGNDALIRQIDRRFANSPFETRTETEEAFSRALLAQLGNISAMVFLVVGAGFFAILLIVASMMASALRERTRELAILKILGFGTQRLLRLVLAEALLLALVGGGAGLCLAAAAVGMLRQGGGGALSRMALLPETWLAGGGLMLLFALLAGGIPGWLALRLPMAAGLARRS